MEKMAIWGVEAICVADALCGDLFLFVGLAGMAIASGSVGKICDYFVVLLCAAGRVPIWWLAAVGRLGFSVWIGLMSGEGDGGWRF